MGCSQYRGGSKGGYKDLKSVCINVPKNVRHVEDCWDYEQNGSITAPIEDGDELAYNPFPFVQELYDRPYGCFRVC